MVHWLHTAVGDRLLGGGEDRDIHFDSMSMGQGATMALPIWAIFMKKVYADPTLGFSPMEKFDIPADYNPVRVRRKMNSVKKASTKFLNKQASCNDGNIDEA